MLGFHYQISQLLTMNFWKHFTTDISLYPGLRTRHLGLSVMWLIFPLFLTILFMMIFLFLCPQIPFLLLSIYLTFLNLFKTYLLQLPFHFTILLLSLTKSLLHHLILTNLLINCLLSPQPIQNENPVPPILIELQSSSLPMYLRGPWCLKRRGNVTVHTKNAIITVTATQSQLFLSNRT